MSRSITNSPRSSAVTYDRHAKLAFGKELHTDIVAFLEAHLPTEGEGDETQEQIAHRIAFDVLESTDTSAGLLAFNLWDYLADYIDERTAKKVCHEFVADLLTPGPKRTAREISDYEWECVQLIRTQASSDAEHSYVHGATYRFLEDCLFRVQTLAQSAEQTASIMDYVVGQLRTVDGKSTAA